MPRHPSGRPIDRITITLYRDQIESLKQLSMVDDRTVSVHIRRAVDEYLEMKREGREGK